MRLNRFLASRGVGARRTCDGIIRDGRVKVNGRTITEPGSSVESPPDTVEVDGSIVEAEMTLIYILLNKPAGYVVTATDPQHRPTVFDLLEGIDRRLFSVGRLDLDVGGLLLLTNDGDLSFRLTHPRYEVGKTYRVHVTGNPEERTLRALQQGIQLEDGVTAPTDISVVQDTTEGTVMEMRMHEGRKRQVKRMWSAIGHPVKQLTRIGFAGLSIDGLRAGQWRYLTVEEVTRLREMVDLCE